MAKPFTVKQIHKKIYPATYNFIDDTVGEDPTGWTTNNDADCTTKVIASLDNHNNILRLSDQSAVGKCEIEKSLGSATADSIHEFWVTKDSVAADTLFNIALQEGGTNIISLQLYEDDLYYHNGVAMGVLKAACITINVFTHIRIVCDDTNNTFDCYIDGALEGDDLSYRNNSTTGIDTIQLSTNDGDTAYKGFFDAYGSPTFDSDYDTGDNYFWKHYNSLDDSFEDDDIGITGTNITFVDGVDTAASVDIIGEFNVHKKVLRQQYGSGAGGSDYSYHTIGTQSKNGKYEFYIKADTVSSGTNKYELQEDAANIVGIRMNGNKFQYLGTGGWTDVTGAPVPSAATWYHIRFEITDAANDTFDLWIDNVRYENNTQCADNQTSGINRIEVTGYGVGDYCYLDAFGMHGDSSYELGDNRLYSYNDTYTREDITSDVITATKYAERLQPISLTFISTEEYDENLYIFQFYDINSKMAFEGEIKIRIQEGSFYTYHLRDKMFDDLADLINNTFSADAIHDASDSTCLLKVALSNVAQEDGDLILIDADVKATTYSPTLINYPTAVFLQDIEDLADSNIIIKATGKVYLDDDLASGSSLDVDTAADRAKFTVLRKKVPIQVTDILDSINYFEIFGAINPDTGARFSKTVDNSSTGDKLRKWRYINNNFRSQTDVDNYAAQLASRLTTIKIIEFAAQDIGDFDLGTTFDFKYVEGVYNVTQANYYIISEVVEFEKNKTTLILSEGMVELSKFAAKYEQSFEDTNQYASIIYDSDLVTHSLPLWPGNGATTSEYGVQLDASLETCSAFIYLPTTLDVARSIEVDLGYKRLDADNDAHDVLYAFQDNPGDGSDNSWTNRDNGTEAFPAVAQNRYNKVSWTIAASTLNAGYLMRFFFTNWDAAAQIAINSVTIRYYIRRT